MYSVGQARSQRGIYHKCLENLDREARREQNLLLLNYLISSPENETKNKILYIFRISTWWWTQQRAGTCR
jgi:hypothetical protein